MLLQRGEGGNLSIELVDRLHFPCQRVPRNGPLPAAKSALFQEWCAGLKNHPEATSEVLDAFYANLYTQEFVYAISREQAAACQTPMLMYPGNDGPHPYAIGEELAKLVPNAEFHPDWKEEPAKSAALQRIRAFLREHTPAR
mgnify:CR=1 FL=1